MADDPKDTPQFNYRVPGEPETIASESRESTDVDESEVEKKIDKEQEAAEKRRDLNQGDAEVSPDHGQSPPQTQLEVDNEDAWSPKE